MYSMTFGKRVSSRILNASSLQITGSKRGVWTVVIGYTGRESKIAQRLFRNFDHLFFRSSKKRIAKPEFRAQALVGNGENSAGLFLPELTDGQERRSYHIDGGDVLFTQFLNELGRFLK